MTVGALSAATVASSAKSRTACFIGELFTLAAGPRPAAGARRLYASRRPEQNIQGRPSTLFTVECLPCRQHTHRERTELLQGTLDMLILRTLILGPAHGHEIAS